MIGYNACTCRCMRARLERICWNITVGRRQDGVNCKKHNIQNMRLSFTLWFLTGSPLKALMTGQWLKFQLRENGGCRGCWSRLRSRSCMGQGDAKVVGQDRGCQVRGQRRGSRVPRSRPRLSVEAEGAKVEVKVMRQGCEGRGVETEDAKLSSSYAYADI